MICFATREASPSLWMEFTNQKLFWVYTRENKAGTQFRVPLVQLQVRAFWFSCRFELIAHPSVSIRLFTLRAASDVYFNGYSCMPPLLKIAVCHTWKHFHSYFLHIKVLSTAVLLRYQLSHCMNAYRNNSRPSTEFICFIFLIWQTRSSVAIKLTNSSQFCRHRYLPHLQKTFSFTACCNWEICCLFPCRCDKLSRVLDVKWQVITSAVTWHFSRDLAWLMRNASLVTSCSLITWQVFRRSGFSSARPRPMTAALEAKTIFKFRR